LHQSPAQGRGQILPPGLLLLPRASCRVLPERMGLRIDALHQARKTAEPVMRLGLDLHLHPVRHEPGRPSWQHR
jgi:hypothetical protein